MKKYHRKAVSQMGDIKAIVSENTTDYGESEGKTELLYRMGENLAREMPKHSLGLKNLGWMFVRASSVERAKTFDMETVSLVRLAPNLTLTAALQIIEQLKRKIYLEFGVEPPAVRQDLKDTHS